MEKHSTVELRELSGLLNDFFVKLSGEKGRIWLRRFKRFLRGEDPWVLDLQDLKTKTLTLGNQSKQDLIGAFLAKRTDVDSSFMQAMLNKVVVGATKKDVTLVFVTGADLLLGTDFLKIEEIYKRALSFGLKLCPSEVGIQLFLQNSQMASEERFYIGMWPTDVFGHRFIFKIFRGAFDGPDGCRISYYDADDFYGKNSVFVFLYPE